MATVIENVQTAVRKLTGTSNCFREFRKLHEQVEADTSKLNSVTAYIGTLQTALNEARQRFFQTLELSDFQKWVDARTKLFAADPCAQEFAGTYGSLCQRATASAESKRIVADCLREMKTAKESQIEQFRAAQTGLLDTILGKTSELDHPEVTNLRREIERLQDVVDRIENSDARPEHAWSNHAGRILEWIQANEPGLLLAGK